MFFSCVLSGFVIGFLFDIFRLSRKYLYPKDVVICLQDILFWILVGMIVLLTVFYTNNGQIRGFVFLGIILGIVLYFLLLSQIVILGISYLINFIFKLIEVIIKPVMMLFRFILKPFRYLCSKFQVFKWLSLKIYKSLNAWVTKLKRVRKIIRENS